MLLQKNSIKIHLLKHNQLNLFQDFIKKHWNQDHIFTENTQLFEWQHKRSISIPLYGCHK